MFDTLIIQTIVPLSSNEYPFLLDGPVETVWAGICFRNASRSWIWEKAVTAQRRLADTSQFPLFPPSFILFKMSFAC